MKTHLPSGSLAVAACALLAVAFFVVPSLAPGFPADCLDNDGDGYGYPGDPSCPNGPETDCDDANGDVYPGAPEVCDGVNNDCDHPGWPSLTSFSERVVSTSEEGAWSVVAADIDGDDDLDVLSASVLDDTIAWHENRAGNGSAWTTHVVTTSADGAMSVFAADLDGDDDLDVLSASSNDDTVAWYENTAGNGSAWTEHLIATTIDGAESVFAADVDGDGDLDVLTAGYLEDTIAWHENELGDGLSWNERPISQTIDGPRSIVAADFDGDDVLDVLSASFVDDTVAWYENRGGDGSVWIERVVSTSANGAYSVFAADVDGDTSMDVLVASYYDDDIAWFENMAGDGTSWAEHVVSGFVDGAADVFVADLDGDGDPDVLSASFEDDTIAWHENVAGDGSTWIEHIVATSVNGAASVSAADLSGDGYLDMLSASYYHDTIAWYLNNSLEDDQDGDGVAECDGDCDDNEPLCIFDCETDLDGDGILYCLDTCVDQDGDERGEPGGAGDDCAGRDCDDLDPNNWVSCATCVDDDGDTYYVGCDTYDTIDGPDCDDADPNNWISCATCVDADGDDFFTGCDAYLTIGGPDCDDADDRVYPGAVEVCDGVNNDCDHPRWPLTSYWTRRVITASADYARSVFAADVDGDDDTDVLSASFHDDTIAWHEYTPGVGDGWIEHVISTSAYGAASVFAADVDGDDDVDVLSASSDDHEIVWHENTAGDGSNWTERVISTSADGAWSVFAADVDGDSDVDVLSASYGDDTIAWYENTPGDGSDWIEHVVSTSADGAASVFAADMDGDDDVDVLSASQLDNTIAWYENTARDGSEWVEHVVSTSALGATAVFVADLDGDADPDVLSASYIDDDVTWYENAAGDGSVWVERTVSTFADGASSVYAADIDLDGVPDVLSASIGDSTIAWYENSNGDGSVWIENLISTSALGAYSVHVADINGDIDVDVLSASYIDDTVAWYEFERLDGDHDSDGLLACEGDCYDDNSNCTDDCETDLDGDGVPYCADSCVDLDGDHYGEPGGSGYTCLGPDCDETNPSCNADCTDADGDGYCVTSDCDDENPQCGVDCTDADDDGYCLPADCDDNNRYCEADCTDSDGDGYCVTTDCDDANVHCAADCTNADGDLLCVDQDCDDADPNNWVSCATCADQDGDTYFAGCDAYVTLLGPDCLDSDPTVYPGAPELCDDLNNDCDNPYWPDIDGWFAHSLSDTAEGALAVHAADVDGDGDSDVLSASRGDDTLAWYDNELGDGSTWTRHVVSTVDDGASSVFAADLDGDDDQDLVLAAYDDNRVLWFRNLAGDGSLWTRHVIVSGRLRPVSVSAADVDGDGDTDALAAYRFDDIIAWYENLFGDGLVWIEHVVLTGVEDARSVFAADLDGDDDIDLLSASYYYDRITWHENAAGDGSVWLEHELSAAADGVTSVFAADVDGDLDLDVLSTSELDNKVAWYENTAGDGSAWTERTISTTVASASSVFAGDVDADGDIDVLSASYVDDQVVAYTNLAGDGSSWGHLVVTENADGAIFVFAADVDGDADLDALAASQLDDSIRLYRREGAEYDDDTDGLRECDGDCDDGNRHCTTDCTDLDEDRFCAGHDCDEGNSDCTDDCQDSDDDGLRVCDGDCDDVNGTCTTDCTDVDGDGFCVTHDCNDGNPNCTADCTDDDGDGYCIPQDCNDAIPRCNFECGDGDGDGFVCADDCDDTDPGSFPGSLEVCTDAKDNDCNGQTDQEDAYCTGLVAPNLRFGSENHRYLVWDTAADAETYGLYRGTFGPTAMDGYDHLCEATLVAGTSAEDPDVPPRREGFYYLVAGQRIDADEFITGPMGLSSAGVSRPDSETITCGPRVYVDPDVVVGGNDGLSWATAYTGVVVALQHQPFGDRGLEVWIRGSLAENAAVTVENRAGAELLGGFAGTEEVSWERSPETTPTTWDPANPNGALLSVSGASVLLDALTLRNGSTGVAGITNSPLVEFREVRVDQLSGYGIDVNFTGPDVSRLNVQNSSFTNLGGGAIHATARGGGVIGLIRRNSIEGATDAGIRLDARPNSEDAEMRPDVVANVISQSRTGIVLTAEVADKPYIATQASFLGSNLIYDTTEAAVIVEALGDFSVVEDPAESRSIPAIVGNTLSDGGGPALLVTATRSDGTGNELQHPVRSEPQVWDNLITHNAGPGIEESPDDAVAGLVADPVVVGNDLFDNTVYYRDEGETDLVDIEAVNALEGAYDNFDADPAYVDHEADDYHLSSGAVLGIGSEMRYLANSAAPGIGMSWVEPFFDDAGWSNGVYGVGYDSGPPPNAEALLRTTVPEATFSVYTRIPFTVTDVTEMMGLILGADFDDGFAAWINGVEVYRSSTLPAGPLDWDTAAAPHESSNADFPVYEFYDISTPGIPALVNGENVLAVGVWNESASSDDLVLVPNLIFDQEYATTDAGHLDAPRIAHEDIDGERRSKDGDRNGISRPDTGADER